MQLPLSLTPLLRWGLVPTYSDRSSPKEQVIRRFASAVLGDLHPEAHLSFGDLCRVHSIQRSQLCVDDAQQVEPRFEQRRLPRHRAQVRFCGNLVRGLCVVSARAWSLTENLLHRPMKQLCSMQGLAVLLFNSLLRWELMSQGVHRQIQNEDCSALQWPMTNNKWYDRRK